MVSVVISNWLLEILERFACLCTETQVPCWTLQHYHHIEAFSET